jgi:dipeptidase E
VDFPTAAILTRVAERQIVAIGGGRACDGLARFLVGLTDKPRPRLLYVGTASAEDAAAALHIYDRFGPIADVTRLEFFPWPPDDLQAQVLESDLVFVGGGNSANMLAIWQVHGVDELLREALDSGVVMAGSSAGGLCWFEAGVTDSFGPHLGQMEYLGFLPGSFCPHYDDEEQRRPRYHELLRGGLTPGYAADAGVGLHFVDADLREVVACEEGSQAYRVELHDGEVVETPIEARQLT